MSSEKRNLVVTVLGRKSCGKSWLIGDLIRSYPSHRVVIFDYTGEYGSRMTERGTGVGAEVHEGYESCEAALIAAHDRERFVLSLRDVYDDELEDLLECAYELERFLLVIEEASRVCTPGRIPRAARKLVAIGRHQEIDQVWCAQRPSMLHRDVTSQSDLVVSFEQHEARDVEWLERAFGEDALRVRELERFKVAAFGPLAQHHAARIPRAVRERLAAR